VIESDLIVTYNVSSGTTTTRSNLTPVLIIFLGWTYK